MAFKNSQAPKPFNLQYFFAMLRGYAPEYGWLITGSEKTSIIKVVKQPKADQKTLDMSIMPPTAMGNGCSVTPAPGQHHYAKGAKVNVYAHPNPDGGWYFTGWTGNVSGKDLIQHVVMDADKIAVGNFDELLLTVSGKKDKRSYCPNEITKNPKVFHLPITVTASTVDDWELQKLSLRTRGTGDEQKDISGVEVYLGNSKRFSGKFSTDNGELVMTFNPDISIGAGESVRLDLYYHFGFNPKTYAIDTTKSFYVETFATVAKPVHYDEGKIAGNAVHDSLTFARVYNTQGYGFSKIQDAVDAKTTRNGDSCIVCAGNYHESVDLGYRHEGDKYTVVYAKDGPDSTVVVPVGEHSAFMVSGSKWEVNGFGIRTSFDPQSWGPYKQTGIFIELAKKSRIIGNKISFYHLGIFADHGDSTKILNNTIRFSDKECILAAGAKYFEIANNIFLGADTKVPIIHVVDGFGLKIHGNGILGNQLTIKLENVDKCDVYEQVVETEGKDNFNELEMKACDDILFEHNKNVNISAENLEDACISENDMGYITLSEGSSNVLIENNIIHNSHWGIMIAANDKGRWKMLRPMNNVISGNKITKSRGYTIWLDKTEHTTIKNNEIYDNPSSTLLTNSQDVLFEYNKVLRNSNAGLVLRWVTRGKIIGNLFNNNETGIVNEFNKYMTFTNNRLVNNHGSHTGIHAYHSDISVIGNQISGNSGGGIKLDESSSADISYNNIYSNEEVQVENKNDTLSSDASNNFWGSPTGPANGDMTGNLTMTGFLKDTVRVVLSAATDTTRVTAETEDSVDVFMNNFVNPADHLQVTLKDEKGWIEALPEDTFTPDSLGVIFPVKFEVPANTGDSIFDQVTVSCHSLYDTSYAASDTFVLASYVAKVSHFSIDPDSSTLHFGDTLRFSVSGIDQYDHAIAVSPVWTASGGTISANGLFTSDSTEGIIEISASIPDKKMTVITKVYNTNQDIYLDRISLHPDSVSLSPGGEMVFNVDGYNQFGFPKSVQKIWTATGGNISSFGLYRADSVPGTYAVIVRDIDSTQTDTAVVIVEDVTGVEQTTRLSSGVKLSQNYPNPFRGKTQISFTLPRPAEVWLSVHDINGREVERLLKARKPAGTYRLTFDATNLPAGTYFYRLQAGGSVQVKKMILLK
jgi:parallel beta-helix repeat protein